MQPQVSAKPPTSLDAMDVDEERSPAEEADDLTRAVQSWAPFPPSAPSANEAEMAELFAEWAALADEGSCEAVFDAWSATDVEAAVAAVVQEWAGSEIEHDVLSADALALMNAPAEL